MMHYNTDDQHNTDQERERGRLSISEGNSHFCVYAYVLDVIFIWMSYVKNILKQIVLRLCSLHVVFFVY